jgi:SAM-dependent methyltransferase
MRQGALSPYEGALRRAAELDLVAAGGQVLPLAIRRYLADADRVDRTVLALCVPPVLDVGCGPGRIVHALSAAGLPALGVDIADVAVALTQQRGAPALIRSVFDRLPGEGRWPTVLVLDGNVGIGGDVAGLLYRLAALMAPGGSVIVEASSTDPATDDVLEVRFQAGGGPIGPYFPWAVVGSAAVIRHAQPAGLVPADQWSAGGRAFLRLVRDTEIR